MNKKNFAIIIIVCYSIFLLFFETLHASSSSLYLFSMEYSFFGVLGILIYLLYEPKISEYLYFNLKPSHLKMFDICFFSLVTIVFAILVNSLYVKPVLYYIFISISFSIIALKILVIHRFSKFQKIITITEILTIGLISISSLAIINKFLIGADAYWHFNKILLIVSSGFIDISAGHYYYYPIGHIYPTILSLIIKSVDVSLTTLSITINTIAVLFVYLVGQETIGEREGLMGSLLFSISVFHSFGSISYSPQILGTIFIFLSFYAVMKCKYNKNYWYPFWISSVATLMIHPVTSSILIFILGFYFIIVKVFNIQGGKAPAPFQSYLMIFISYILFVNIMLFNKLVKTIFIPEAEFLITQLSSAIKINFTFIYFFETIVAYLGPCIMLMLGILGSLVLIQRKEIKSFPIILVIFLLNIILIISILGNLSAFQPTRFLPFSDILLTIPAGFGIVYLFKLFRLKRGTISIMFILFFIFSFFSSTSYLINEGNMLFTKEVIVHPVYVTQSTLASHNYLMLIPENNTIHTDSTTANYIFDSDRGIFSLNSTNLNFFNETGLNENGYYVINNQYLPYGTYTLQDTSMKLNSEIIDDLYK
jgi:hypothetical protein